MKYIGTHEMIALILTKPLPKYRFEKLVTKLGISLSNKQRQKWECCYFVCYDLTVVI